MTSSPLFEPLTVGALTLPNRIVMAPLTRSRASEDGVVPEYARDYYAQRASAGLIITEATNISPQGRGYAWTPGIWSDAQVEAWSGVTGAVHAAGGRIVLQLWHTGRVSHPDLHGGDLPVAPSALRPDGEAFTREGMKRHVTPRALETDEIPGVVEDYRHAAQQAKAAGFDGVELHCANMYLLDQFLRDGSNRREDEYGGSVENRIRFPLAALQAVVDVWGGDRVGARISPATATDAMPVDSTPTETFGALLDGFAQLRIAYTHLITGVTQTTRETPDAIDLAELRRRAPGAFMDNNDLSVEAAEQELRDGTADLACFGRAFIANPDLVERIRLGAPLAEAPKRYWYGGDSTGYSDWPAVRAA